MRKRIIICAVLAIVLVSTLSVAYLFLRPPTSNERQILIAGVTLTVEIANTPTEQTKGLSGRDKLPQDHGMLFVFDHEDFWGFWMIEMKFPLDIIWFNSNKQAVYVEQNLPPCTPQACPVFVPPVKATYVLEVDAGFAEIHNVTLGAAFTFLS